MTEARPRLHALLLSLAAGLMVAPVGLEAQSVSFATEIREGDAFRRVVTTSNRVESPTVRTDQEWTVELGVRIAELREDGSGTLELVIDAVRFRLETSGVEPRSWDSRVDPVEEAEEFHPIVGMIGRVFEIPFLEDGAVDVRHFQSEPASDMEVLELWNLMTLWGPENRADALPANVPATLEAGVAYQAGSPHGFARVGPWSFRLEGVTEEEDASVARVAFEASGAGVDGGADVEAELSGHILFDLDARSLVELVRGSRITVAAGDATQYWAVEDRTEPVR
jgi:hypothetical protein